MNTKLTLMIDKDLIPKAKEYARKTGRSLSDMVENYFKSIIRNDELNTALSPRVESLMGSFHGAGKFNYKEELGKSLDEKYGNPDR